jgi:hypothetical protein
MDFDISANWWEVSGYHEEKVGNLSSEPFASGDLFKGIEYLTHHCPGFDKPGHQ